MNTTGRAPPTQQRRRRSSVADDPRASGGAVALAWPVEPHAGRPPVDDSTRKADFKNR
jgi:hypothetical protein